jgi:DNA-binding MarR family transcriptional regulator
VKTKPVEDSIGILLTQICKYRRNKSNTLLAETGIHTGQDILLYHLSIEDGQTVSSLVDKICIQHATIFNMIDRMESSGMIRKEKDSLDKRISRVYLTDKGKEAMDEVAKTWRTMETITTKGLTNEQQKELNTLLQMVLNNLK